MGSTRSRPPAFAAGTALEAGAGSHERLQLPGYELLEPLGAGGYGTVFLASQHKTGRLVAIKVARLQGDARRAARFHRETDLCARLHHPHIVPLLDKGQEGPNVYGVFEYIPGETLKSHIRRKGALSALETGHIMSQVLDALDCAHRAGIVHRDLKPDNIMITRTGVLTHAMVLDFGISTLVPQARGSQFATLTMTEECLGTPSYCAPEQLRGELPSIQSDIYAWGLTFLECLTGRAAIGGVSAAEIFHQQLSAQEVPLPPEIAAHPLGALLRRALKKSAAERCGTASALLLELEKTRLDDLVGKLQSERQRGDAILTRTASTPRGFAEKRQVTVVCCSVTVWPLGTDDASEPADVEQLELAQREEFSAFSDAAVRRGGMLAGSLGDRMVVLFGYPYACDTDARRAAATALDLIALAARRGDALSQKQSARLSVRLGMHTGMGVVTPGEAPSGHAVNLAMRLENLAEPGSILVSESSGRLLRPFAELQAAADRVAPAREQGLRAFRLGPELSRSAGPAMARGAFHGLCVGREREFGQLWAAWEQARIGHGHTVIVRGEPGIGKSCIVDGLRERVAKLGFQILRGQCMPEHRNSALAPILGLLRQRLDGPHAGGGGGEAATQRLESALRAAGCDTARVLPIFCAWLSLPLGPQAPSQISPALQRDLLLKSIAQWLFHLARQAPLLIVLEDLHWVDPTTTDLLEQLMAAAPCEPLLLVLTARPAWVPPAGLPQQTVAPSRLDHAQAAMVASHVLAPRNVDPVVIEHIIARTDGVPLFVQELAKMLAETHLTERDGLWVFKDGARPTSIPSTLRDSLIGRFDQLGAARDVLQLAATIGRDFELDLLRACAGPQASGLPDALNALLDAGLIAEADGRPAGAYVFRHALIRDTAYDCMVSAQRRLKHRAVAQTLARLHPQLSDDEPGLIARHYGEAGEHARAVELGIRQLGITQLRSLNDETVAYARQVEGWIGHLAEAQQGQARLDVNGYLTQALMNKHGWANAQVKEKIALSQSLLKGSVAYEQEVRHLWSMITYHHVASNRAEVRQLSGRLMALAKSRQDESVLVAACTYVGLARYSDGDFTGAEQTLSEAIERYKPRAHAHHARQLGFDTRVWASSGRALVRWFAGHDGASADAAQAIEWAREIGHAPSLSMALLYQGLGFQAAGDRANALRTMDELLQIGARHGLPAFQGYAQIIRCWATGDIAPADQAIEALWQMGCRYCQTYYRAFAADTLAQQGRWGEALARITDSLVLVDQLDEHMYSAELHLARARCLRGAGSEQQAVDAALHRAAEIARHGGKVRTLAEAGIETVRAAVLAPHTDELSTSNEGCTT
jgi:TOMM system kinase/cyclase fusion protein